MRVQLSRGVCSYFQQWWWGQADPLYAVLSRGCDVLGPIKASEAEIDRLCETAQDILKDKRSRPLEKAVATRFSQRPMCRRRR